MNSVHENLIRDRSDSVEDLETLILIETNLISKLENTPVTPEYHGNSHYAKGEYAVHLTEIQDAYWRRRTWREKLDELGKDDFVSQEICSICGANTNLGYCIFCDAP